jgi:hypothetical protein
MASDPRDYKLDIAGVKKPEKSGASRDRPYLSIHFACCSVYSRVYRNKDGSAYAGRCPRCGRTIKFPIGDGGTDQRFFIVE